MNNNKRRNYQQPQRAMAVAIPVGKTPWGRLFGEYEKYKWTASNPTLLAFVWECLKTFMI